MKLSDFFTSTSFVAFIASSAPDIGSASSWWPHLTKVGLAILGFAGGLAVPWVKRRMEAEKERDTARRALVVEWREAVSVVSNMNSERERVAFTSTSQYSSLRRHMDGPRISTVEAVRTVHVGGGRGGDVVRNVLLDEMSRIEKQWNLI